MCQVVIYNPKKYQKVSSSINRYFFKNHTINDKYENDTTHFQYSALSYYTIVSYTDSDVARPLIMAPVKFYLRL